MKKTLPARAAIGALLCASAAMTASAQTTDYPEGAEPLTQDALHAALADKVFSITPARGPKWQWTFKPDGQFYLSAGNYSNSGKWSAKDSSLCQESVRTTGCHEVRQKDGVLYLKRDSGEVISFQPK